MGAPPGILAAASPVPVKNVRAGALKATFDRQRSCKTPKREARDQKRRAGGLVRLGNPGGTLPTHPTLVRTSARARSTDQASRSPRGFADALSIIPSGR